MVGAGENTDMLSLFFKVLKEHKDVVREILSGFSLFPELFGSTSPTIIFSLNGRLIGVLAD